MRRISVLLTIVAVCLGVTAGAAVADTDERHARDIETTTPIKHFVTLMQENHSFDNYFGTYPGADGVPDDLCMPMDNEDPSSECVEPFRIGDDPIVDLAHSDKIFDAQFNDGKMDGFISAFANGGAPGNPLSVGYYDDDDLPYYWNIADEYVLFDRMFSSARGGSVRNHMFWATGQAGAKFDGIPPEGFELETIFDRLEEADISWKFYVQNYDPTITFRDRGDGDRGSQIVWVPLLNFPRYLDDPELFAHIVPLEEYFTDLEDDTLPAVSYIVPAGSSEHPPGSIAAGEAFVRTLINSLMRSEAWDATAFTWTYDDWGGWYDHVPPPQVDDAGYGFRVPALLVSPYAKRGHVDNTELDFTSMLKFIQENWDVEPLATRDAAANNFLSAFDFEAPPREAVILPRSREIILPEEPKRAIVYASYSGALGLFALVVIGAALQSRRRNQRTVPAVTS